MSKEFVVYLVVYTGDKHPPYYIGSTSKRRLDLGYRGSVRGRVWGSIFKKELKENPELYTYEILAECETREEALLKEKEIQIENNVVKSEKFMNRSLACVGGFFGMDVRGDKNPSYGRKKTERMLNSVKVSNSGKVNVSEDAGVTWRRVPTEEYWANREKYTTAKGEFNHATSEATRRRVSEGTHHFCSAKVQQGVQEKRKAKGWKHTEDGIKRIAEARKLNPSTPKGFKQRVVTCPTCKKSGGANNMARYHFNNCKFFVGV